MTLPVLHKGWENVSIWTWLKDKFGGGSRPLSGDSLDGYIDEYALVVGDIYIREMAFWSATNLMANAISKCEFKTYLKGDEVKKQEYYLWNVEPNKNQNSSAFLHKLIASSTDITNACHRAKRAINCS